MDGPQTGGCLPRLHKQTADPRGGDSSVDVQGTSKLMFSEKPPRTQMHTQGQSLQTHIT